MSREDRKRQRKARRGSTQQTLDHALAEQQRLELQRTWAENARLQVQLDEKNEALHGVLDALQIAADRESNLRYQAETLAADYRRVCNLVNLHQNRIAYLEGRCTLLEAKLGARDLASELQATVTQLRFRVAHLEADVRHLEAENLELLRRSGAASAPKMDLGTWRLLLQVAHPDKHPPERQEAATRATQWLTGNKPASAT